LITSPSQEVKTVTYLEACQWSGNARHCGIGWLKFFEAGVSKSPRFKVPHFYI
jgi:hypothetical protein